LVFIRKRPFARMCGPRVGFFITSERRLCEEVKMHVGYRWFVGLTLEDKVPDHSTFSKNRHERFHEGDLLQQLFDEIVNRGIS